MSKKENNKEKKIKFNPKDNIVSIPTDDEKKEDKDYKVSCFKGGITILTEIDKGSLD